MPYKYLIFCFLFLFSACLKDTITLDWQELKSGIKANLASISFSDAQNGYIAGGNTWYNGYVLATHDGGNTWATDSVWYNQMYGVHASPDGKKVRAVGMFSRFLKKESTDLSWQPRPTPAGDIWLRDIAFVTENRGIAVGGGGFQNGHILLLDKNEKVLSWQIVAGELEAVCFSDTLTAHAVGYGTVIRSQDGGKTWVQNAIDGDFFQCVHFPTAQTGYIVGYNGSILKTTDAGTSWKKLRDGNGIGVSDLPFRSVFFVDEKKGYIVGEGGIFWRTSDGGTTWHAIENFPKIDLYDVVAVKNTGFIVGEKGKIFRFRD
jgi:photosystem II stability/assembly factor-like uncharacterized protein